MYFSFEFGRESEAQNCSKTSVELSDKIPLNTFKLFEKGNWPKSSKQKKQEADILAFMEHCHLPNGPPVENFKYFKVTSIGQLENL